MERRRRLQPLDTTAEELYSRHFGGFGLNSLVALEDSVNNPEADAATIGGNLAFFFRCFDRAGHQIQWDQAPTDVRERALALRDMSVERLRAAGLDPAIYGYGEPPEVI